MAFYDISINFFYSNPQFKKNVRIFRVEHTHLYNQNHSQQMLKMTKFLSSLFAFIAIVSIVSCGDTGAKGPAGGVQSSIPADAAGVFLMNTKQLMEKADYASLKQTDFFKDFLKEAETNAPEMVPFLEDPAASGLSLESNMGFYFAFPEGENQKIDKPNLAFIVPVADVAKLDAAVQEALKKAPEAKTTEKEGYKITNMDGEGNAFLVQSEKIFAFTSFDTDEDIKNIISPSGNDISQNAKFVEHNYADKDMSFWMDATPIVKTMMSNPFMAMSIKGSLGMAQIPEEGLKDNYMSFYYDFKDGEIVAAAKFEFSEPLVRELGDLLPSKLNVDYSKHIPTDDLAVGVTMGVNGAGILNFIAKRGLDQTIDKQLAAMGLTLGKINDGITGDMALAVYPPKGDNPEPTFLTVMGIKDKAFIEGLLEKFGPMMNVQKEGNKYTMIANANSMDPTAKPMTLHLITEDDIMLLSNNSETLNQAVAGTSNAQIKKLQDGWMGAYINYDVIGDNYDKILAMIPNEANISVSKRMMEYQGISVAEFVAKGATIEGTTKFKNSAINSLKHLIQVGDKMYKDRELIEAEMKKQMEDEFGDFDEEFGDFEENT